jgi:hypothetical protein
MYRLCSITFICSDEALPCLGGNVVVSALASVCPAGRVHSTSRINVFERGGHRFEIVDMDGTRVDRVLIGWILSKNDVVVRDMQRRRRSQHLVQAVAGVDC